MAGDIGGGIAQGLVLAPTREHIVAFIDKARHRCTGQCDGCTVGRVLLATYADADDDALTSRWLDYYRATVAVR
jgi:superfamily II DNA/RNA helicase